MKEFDFDGLSILCPSIFNLQYLYETFLFDVYNSKLINKEDTILDIGAGSGDFCFLASKKIRPTGKVISIEPNPNDYQILLKNIERNNIHNIIPVNIGVGKKGRETITFRGNTFSFNTDTLNNILNDLNIDSVDFIKLDIEGYEVDVIKKSQDIIEKARVISLEFHNTKEQVDSLLLNLGFKCVVLNTKYLIKSLSKNIMPHPLYFVKVLSWLYRNDPKLFYKILKGHDKSKDKEGVFHACYIK